MRLGPTTVVRLESPLAHVNRLVQSQVLVRGAPGQRRRVSNHYYLRHTGGRSAPSAQAKRAAQPPPASHARWTYSQAQPLRSCPPPRHAHAAIRKCRAGSRPRDKGTSTGHLALWTPALLRFHSSSTTRAVHSMAPTRPHTMQSGAAPTITPLECAGVIADGRHRHAVPVRCLDGRHRFT